MRLSRRRVMLAGAAAPILAMAQTHGFALPASVSLPDELGLALSKMQPLLVMVSLDGCPFCKVARQSYLVPLVRQGWTVVQVDMRSTRWVKNLNGASQSHDDLIRSWGIRLAPTVLFIGPGGVELAERLSGAYIPDFYGAYLEERLAKAQAKLNSKPTTSIKS